VFNIDQSRAILGPVWSGRDVPRPTQGVVGSEPDLLTVGLDGLQTSADVCQATPKNLLFCAPEVLAAGLYSMDHVLPDQQAARARGVNWADGRLRKPP